MAKKRYSLDETAEDVLKNIEGAKQTSASDNQSTTLTEQKNISNPEQGQMQNLSQEVNSDNNLEVFPVKSPRLSESEIKNNKKTVISSENGRKNKKLFSSVTEKETTGKTNTRNVDLDDETLWRLDFVKNKLNNSRRENDPWISQKTIIGTALIEWLDTNYPDTKKAYQIINNL